MDNTNSLQINFFSDSLKSIESKTGQLLNRIVSLLADSDYTGLCGVYDMVKSSKYSGKAYLESLDAFDDTMRTVFDVGYLQALLNMMQLYERRMNVEKEIDKIRTSYRNQIFYYLGTQTAVMHKDLASCLNVSASGLNAVIKHMNAGSVKTVNVEKVSKFTVYSLTAAAYQYAVSHRILAAPRKDSGRTDYTENNYIDDFNMEITQQAKSLSEMKKRIAAYVKEFAADENSGRDEILKRKDMEKKSGRKELYVRMGEDRKAC